MERDPTTESRIGVNGVFAERSVGVHRFSVLLDDELGAFARFLDDLLDLAPASL